MEQLTPLEKEIIQECFGLEPCWVEVHNEVFEGQISLAKACAALCERKMREAWDDACEEMALAYTNAKVHLIKPEFKQRQKAMTDKLKDIIKRLPLDAHQAHILIQAVKESEEEMNQMVSVKERLPEEDEDVICCDNHDSFFAELSKVKFFLLTPSM